MKRKSIVFMLCITVFFAVFFIQQVQADSLKIDPRTVRVGVGEQATVNVTCTNCFDTGYYYFMANPSIASYFVVSDGPGGAIITITGLAEGSTTFSVTAYTSGTTLTVSSDIIVSNVACPATTALEKSSQKKAKLGILYDFRDSILAGTPTGQNLIRIYYENAEEMTNIMISDKDILFRTISTMNDFMFVILSIVEKRPVTITPEELAQIDVLLEAYSQKAGPGLQHDLRLIQNELADETILECLGIVSSRNP